MAFEEILKKSIAHIRSRKLKSEAQVKNSVIEPILSALDWDTTDPAEVELEFSVARGRVDYALLNRSGDPLVFIEAKLLGKMDPAGVDQVFRYAYNQGVPFLILTDGDTWDFYLAMAAGVPDKKRFYRAELTREERIPEYVESLNSYLRKSRVVSDEAHDDAKKRLKSNLERTKAREAIPNAWRALLENPKEARLGEILAEEVESQCGTKPDMNDVKKFLKGLDIPPAQKPRPPAPTISAGKAREAGIKPPRPEGGGESSQIKGFILDGEHFEARNAIETLAGILKAFAARDPEFMDRFAPRVEGKSKTADGTPKRRLVARSRNDLYIHSKLAQEASRNLGNGWWLGTNHSTARKRRYIQVACEVAGVKFGSQLSLIKG